MNQRELLKIVVVVIATAVAGISRLALAQTLGTIDFPTSANTLAQTHFIEGIKDLHSFAYDEAALAFQAAEKADPGFVLAYWGEAASYYHSLWHQYNFPASRAALLKLGPTLDSRLAKARNDKERAYLESQDILLHGTGDVSPGEIHARDLAYADALAKLHDRWPDDDEITTFYALALLSSVRPGDSGYRRQALAASILLPIFQKNPDHPGAAHFIIHAFDDSDLAILALPAARVYAKIAPDAPHALHMPSHIFVRLGLWDDVRSSNTAAYASNERLIARLHVPEGHEDFHALSWLQYANLQLHRFDEAAQDLEFARQTLVRNPNSDAVRNGYLTMRARQVIETESWADQSLEPDGLKPNGPWLFAAGLSAAHRKDFDTALRAVDALKQLANGPGTGAGDSVPATEPAIIEAKEIEAEIALQRGNTKDALTVAHEASDIELSLRSPSGPPEPIKPAPEFYAELLAQTGAGTDAATVYKQQLLRTPNRTLSVKGLAGLGGTAQQAASK
jgi:hypothetical protein